MAWKKLIVLLIAAVVVGCGGPTSVKVDAPSAGQEVKSMLQSMAEEGAPFSGWEDIGRHIAELKKTDPDKAAAVEAGVAEINGMTDAAARKAKAKELAEGL